MKEGKTRGEVAAEVGVSRMTLWRDLHALDAKFGAENSERVRELKAKVGEALLKAADEVWQGAVPAEVANAWRAIVADFSKLLGLNAESRAVVAHVSVEAEAAKLAGYRRFVRETQWVRPEKFHLIWDFVRTIEEPPTPQSTALLLPEDDQ